MSRRNTNTRYDLRTIVDRYISEQVARLGPLDPIQVPVFVPVPVTPKRNRRKRAHA